MKEWIAAAVLLALLGCVNVHLRDDGSLKHVSSYGTAEITIGLDEDQLVEELHITTDGANAVPLFGSLFDAISSIGSAFFGGSSPVNIHVQAAGATTQEE